MKTNNYSDNKLNNGGFTLVEVIIAVIILVLVSIPLMRSFATSAQTTGKAAVKVRATNAAENLMEDIRGMSKDEVLKKYGNGVTTPNVNGKITGSGQVAYELILNKTDSSYDDDLNKIVGNSEYKVSINLDPSTYPNANKLNLSDFNTVNSDTSAVFCLTSDVDTKAYRDFIKLNETMNKEYIKKSEFFEKELKREIRVDVSKSGKKNKDKDGNEFDAVDVSVSVTYLLPDGTNVVPKGKEQLVKVRRQIFNGTLSGKELQSIYVMYPPRYEAAKDSGDIIIIHNPDNVEANLYIVAQDTNKHSEDWKKYCKKLTGGLILQIYEDEIADVVKGGNKQPLTLYTNLHGDVDYQKKDTSVIVPVQCFITLQGSSKDPEGKKDTFDKKVYDKIKSKTSKFEDKDVTKALDARSIDGKSLDASAIEDRMYDVTVTVEKQVAADEWPVKVELTGSILE